jgi:hypothetical protein
LNQGLLLPVRVNSVDKRAADSIAARLTKDNINLGLKNADLPPATLLEAAAVVQTATSEVEASLLMGPAITVGANLQFQSFLLEGLLGLSRTRHKSETNQPEFCICSTCWKLFVIGHRGQGRMLRVISKVRVFKRPERNRKVDSLCPSGSSQQFGSQDFGGAETSVAAASASPSQF